MKFPMPKAKGAKVKETQHQISVSFYLTWHVRGIFNLSPLADALSQVNWIEVAEQMLANDNASDEIVVEPTSNDRLRIYIRRLVTVPIDEQTWEELTKETDEIAELRALAAQKKQKRSQKNETKQRKRKAK